MLFKCSLQTYPNSQIVKRTKNEIKLAIEHLKNMKNRFNIRKLITVLDRGYVSIELMI